MTHQRARATGAWTPLSTRLDETGHLVTRLVGMNLTQFTQVAMLPQGRFQAFLRASSEERHQLLQRLFRTGRFEDVERWLRDRRLALRRASPRPATGRWPTSSAGSARPPTRACPTPGTSATSPVRRAEGALVTLGLTDLCARAAAAQARGRRRGRALPPRPRRRHTRGSTRPAACRSAGPGSTPPPPSTSACSPRHRVVDATRRALDAARRASAVGPGAPDGRVRDPRAGPGPDRGHHGVRRGRRGRWACCWSTARPSTRPRPAPPRPPPRCGRALPRQSRLESLEDEVGRPRGRPHRPVGAGRRDHGAAGRAARADRRPADRAHRGGDRPGGAVAGAGQARRPRREGRGPDRGHHG